MYRIVTGSILAFTGLFLCWGGIQLAWHGGSVFYLAAGVVFVVTAGLIVLRSPWANGIYGVFTGISLVWAVWEVGLDWWQLAPRGGLIVLVGFWILLAGSFRRRPRLFAAEGMFTAGNLPLSLSLVLCLVIGLLSLSLDTNDVDSVLSDASAPSAKTDPAKAHDVAGDWPHYGRTLHGQRYSPLAQITPDNIGSLREAWRYRTGDVRRDGEIGEGSYQVTPLKIGDSLYICTPHSQAIALDATTGRQKWRFDAQTLPAVGKARQTCRGVSYYQDPSVPEGQLCKSRLYFAVAGAKLIAIDAERGVLCSGFGKQGIVDLLAGHPFRQNGFLYNTSPPVITGGKVIIGGAVSDNAGKDAPSGVIRAYDIDDGHLVWNWDTGNPDRTAPIGPGETYTQNSPNTWSISSADEALGLIYVPMGNQVPDHLGGNRSASAEKLASSIVALDTATGRLRWVRQTVHHDLWDMDVPAQPSLLTLKLADGTTIPALVGPTKQGDVYVLDRRTGEPIIPVREVAAPKAAMTDQMLSPTQPVSGLTFMPEPLTETDMWGLTMLDQMICRLHFRKLRYEGRFTPPSLEGSIIYPGNFGVFNWGSVTVDPERQIMFAMPTYLAFTTHLVPRDRLADKAPAKRMKSALIRNDGLPYGVRLAPFLGPLGIPCQAPPWGYVAAADLRTGEILYKRANGTIRDLTPLPLPLEMGVPGIGGPIVTAGGVAFLGATLDDYIRGYDIRDGTVKWSARLPAGGQATPITYENRTGKQIVVIVAGGHATLGTTSGDYVVAYELP